MKQRINENDDRKESELLVFVKAKDLSAYILLISGKSPVKYRYSLLNPLINSSLEDAKDYIATNYGDLQEWLKTEIEASINKLKN